VVFQGWELFWFLGILLATLNCVFVSVLKMGVFFLFFLGLVASVFIKDALIMLILGFFAFLSDKNLKIFWDNDDFPIK